MWRNVLGVGLVVLLVAGAAVVHREWVSDAQQKTELDARRLAAASSQQVADAIGRENEKLLQRAEVAASVPRLETTIREGLVATTVNDLLATELWWEPYRGPGMSSAVYEGGELLAASGPAVELLHAKPAIAFASAADTGGASTVLSDGTAVLLTAAVRMSTETPDGRPAVVALMRAIDLPLLEQVSTAVGSGLTISNGATALARAGATRTPAPIGHEREAPVMGNGTMASATALADGLWVWTEAAVPAPAAPPIPLPVLLFVALLVGGVLAFAVRARSSSGTDQLLADTAAQLKTQQEQLHRISQSIAGSPAGSGTITIADANPLRPAAMGRTTPSLQATPPSRYEVVAPLGEGGMAKVFVAVTRGAANFKRHFVLKRLRAEMSTNAEIVSQFIDEARLGASLVHSNVVPVFDFGRDEEGYYLATEFILGRDLDAVRTASLQKRGRPLELELVMLIAREALKALSYAHAHADATGQRLNLVHRDVSPNNLMVSAQGEVKLLDFGIVKSDDKLTKTQTGIIKGNVFYMSPEQARGTEVDARADLFSLGLVLFCAATSEALYRGVTNYDLLVRSGEGLGDSEWQRVRALPTPLRELLERVLRVDPGERFQSADEFLRAIPPASVANADQLKQLMAELFAGDFERERVKFFGGGA